MWTENPKLASDAEEFAHPHPKRRYQNVFCVVIFVLAFLGYVIISAFAFSYGDPENLFNPTVEFIETEIETFAVGEFSILRHDLGWICVGLFSACILALIWFIVVRYVSIVIIYLSIVISIIMTAALGFYLYTLSRRYNSNEFLLLSCLCWLITFIIVIFTIMFKNKIALTTAIIKEAGGLVKENLSVMVIVFVFSLIYIAFVIFAVIVVLYLYTVPSNGPETYPLTYSGVPIQTFSSVYRSFGWVFIALTIWFTQVLLCTETYLIAEITYRGLKKRATDVDVYAEELSDSTKVAKSFGTIVFAAFFSSLIPVFTTLSNRINVQSVANWAIIRGIASIAEFFVDSVIEYTIIFSAVTGRSFGSSITAVVGILKDSLAVVISSHFIITYVFFVGQILGSSFVTVFTVWIVEVTHHHISVITVLLIFITSFYIFKIVAIAYSASAKTVFIVLLEERGMKDSIIPKSILSIVGELER